VYFALAYGTATQAQGLYRIKLDGTGLEHIGRDGSDYFASPSHDGQSVAYASARTVCFNVPCIRVLDLATNQDRTYGTQDFLVQGAMAAWSPVEDLIAYSNGSSLYLVRSDGTGTRTLASDVGQVKWMDWSPDGRWLVVAADPGVMLLEAQTGLRLPLGQFSSYGATAWRP
jgi:Tol biopolymer transport system component